MTIESPATTSDGPTTTPAVSDTGRSVPARVIPVPSSISPYAQATLSAQIPEGPPYPPLTDVDAWRQQIAEQNLALLAMPALARAAGAVDVSELDIAGVTVYELLPDNRPAADDRVYLDIHGGALIVGGGEACKLMAISSLSRVDCRILSVDYRMPPDHPYPAALDDCLAVYRALLEEYRPDRIVVGGASAGGNLAAALMLRARDEGLPLPAAVVLLTPEVDLTHSGDTFVTNMGVDSVLTRDLTPANLLYAGGHDLSHPYLSPLFGDFDKGFPPTFLQTGTRDLFLSNTVRMHRALRAAGVPVELHVFEAMPHGGFYGAPEDAEVVAEVRRFIAERCPR